MRPPDGKFLFSRKFRYTAPRDWLMVIQDRQKNEARLACVASFRAIPLFNIHCRFISFTGESCSVRYIC